MTSDVVENDTITGTESAILKNSYIVPEIVSLALLYRSHLDSKTGKN